MSRKRDPEPPAVPGDDEDDLVAALAEALRTRDADDSLTRETTELILPGVPFS